MQLLLIAINLKLSLIAIMAFVIIGLILTAMILFTKLKLVTSSTCQIKINNDDSLTIDVDGGGTLLSILTENNIAIPSPCGGKATCKQCKVQVQKGGGNVLETETSSFSTKQLREGWRLSCQCKVKDSLDIQIPGDLLSVQTWKGKVIENKNVATFIKELSVEIPEEIPYKSGGYLQISVPPFQTNTSDWKEMIDPQYHDDWEKFGLFDKQVDFSKLNEEIVRAYSMASYPAEGKRLLFNIRIATPPPKKGGISDKIPWGICSSYIFSLKANDEIQLSGPYGESFMIDDDRELIFLIGGAGSSFSRSHILHLFHTEKTTRAVTLWYGARSLKENIYQEEYEQLEKEYNNFHYHLVLSEPTNEDLKQGWPKEDAVKTNFLFKAFEEGQLVKMEEPEECLYYICGPPLHNQSIIKLLDDYGVPEENIVLDDFGN